eukprot:jgi/Galph1/1620/GphlegSOOS_G322.1
MAENTQDELIYQVDLQNQVVGSCRRKEMRSKNLPHRASYILVFDPDQRLVVQKRTNTKDYCPGYYEVTTGGVNSWGETKEDCAKRELLEELGIDVPLEYCFPFFYQDNRTTVWGDLWTCTFYGKVPDDLQLQKSEVESVELMSIEEILQSNNLWTPDSLYALQRWLSGK